MKYVVYIECKGDKDSFICDNKAVLQKELKALKSERWTVTDICKIVKGEYISIK